MKTVQPWEGKNFECQNYYEETLCLLPGKPAVQESDTTKA